MQIAFFEPNLARFEEKIFFENFKKKLKICHFEKNIILDNIFDFSLALHTLTICLRSCYHDYLRNFCVTCIPIACQCIFTCQSVVRYPVQIQGCFFTRCWRKVISISIIFSHSILFMFKLFIYFYSAVYEIHLSVFMNLYKEFMLKILALKILNNLD